MKDQLGRVIEFTGIPKRIVSLVPSQTELLCDLGLEESLVGVTKFCVHPNNIKKETTIVGGTKTIKVDVVKALNPDIILCNKEENTKEIVSACEGIAVVHVSDIETLAHSIELIEQYGVLFEKYEAASRIIESIRKKHADFKLFIANKPIKKVAYFIWSNPWMVAANHTFINYLLELNNYENVYAHQSRYPVIDLLDLKEKSTELILLSSEPYLFKKHHELEIAQLIPNAKVLHVDGEYFSWYGSRLIKAFDYFKILNS